MLDVITVVNNKNISNHHPPHALVLKILLALHSFEDMKNNIFMTPVL
jgi:hypothetical protein